MHRLSADPPDHTGRLKNKSARRVIVIADELIRLGFLRYVEAMRARWGATAVPRVRARRRYQAEAGRRLLQAVVDLYRAERARPEARSGDALRPPYVSDELKDQEVFIEFRNDLSATRGPVAKA